MRSLDTFATIWRSTAVSLINRASRSPDWFFLKNDNGSPCSLMNKSSRMSSKTRWPTYWIK